MPETKKKSGGCITIILILIILPFAIFELKALLGNQIVDYPALRQNDGRLLPLNRTIYKPTTESQTIIYWMPGIHESPEKLVDCVVRDKRNWVGTYPDQSGKVIMENGKIKTDLHPEFTRLNAFHWWYLELGGF